MKRIVTMFLVLTLVLSLCACAGGGEKTPEGLLVGYSRQSIMPDDTVPNRSVGLGGYSNAEKRMSTGFLDYIYTTCIAFTYGDETILLFTEDLIGKGQKMTGLTRAAITEATGIPGDHIMASGTHTHAGPDTNISKNDEYKEMFIKVSVKAAVEALANRVPATIAATNVQTEGMNFTRHYLENDGAVTSSNMGNITYDKVVDHACTPDNEMVLYKFDREGNNQDVVLMNWAAHPCASDTEGSSGTVISADYIGSIRTAFEKETGMQFAFFQGGGGNMVTDSRIKEKAHGMEDRVEYGTALAKIAIEALPTMEEIPCDGIQIAQTNLKYAKKRHQDAELYEKAKEVMKVFKSANAEAANVLAREMGFLNKSHAQDVANHYGEPEDGIMELNSFRIGDVAFTTTPWETFSDTSVWIKDNSPYKYTMVLSIANNRIGYQATKEAFGYVCYESLSSSFAAGAAEAAAEQLVNMLKDFQK